MDFQGETETVKATEGDGMFTLITAAAAIALFVVGLVRKNDKIASFSALPSLITVGLALFNFLDPERLARSYVENDSQFEGATSADIDALFKEIDFSAGAGLYIVLLGAIAALVAGVMSGMKARQSQ
jgi:hypothetical protein